MPKKLKPQFKIPKKLDRKKGKDFVSQINWQHFWSWKGAPRKAA